MSARVFTMSVALLAGASCAGSVHRTRPLSRLDAEYLRGRVTTRAAPVAATHLYREVLARSLGARCQMFPTDSQLFDRRAEGCRSAAVAAVFGIARLYLETAANPALMPSLLAEGRVRWLDLPPREACGP
jgi:hypothetical protein